MGTCWQASVVQDLIDNIPKRSILMLDEAYHDFAEGTVPALDMENPNVIRFRTFSKAYGMAGVRVGYAMGHPSVISAFDKIRNHFGVNRMGQAGAMAALADHAYLDSVKTRVARAREKIYAIAKANGLKPIPSFTNFVAVDCGRDGAYARKIVDGLATHGIFVRMPGVAPLNRCIRISVGNDENLAALEKALPAVISAAN
jgi:histidinol-phosphate aminotransferase